MHEALKINKLTKKRELVVSIKKLFQIGLIGVLALTVVGCQTTRRTLNLNTTVELVVDTRNNVNPDDDGRASPVVVRVFMLADERQFAREDFLNLYENAQSRLGKDLIDTVILKEFAPGEQRIEELALTPDVKYIGLLAEFVQYQDAEALIVLPIMDHKKNEYQISLADIRIGTPDEIAKRRPEKLSNLSQRDSSDGDTVTISKEDYEKMKKTLPDMQQSQ
ncbi:type VI secretion system lipoprotein TssJ [Microbulbifer sp. OS29]|uniref:Type VI secretion system lipoprotein TssJ n=1 Tax=Microbulbifer okhotskensis TaxID=2926617 RepID=A0A9X2J4U9_9GAMM|nr:type VI secretion system lipoprotein TssJ [Microbulbifer okhotskensis]MCO1332940.1 type VI secretion system lipoprotein TssJ [Microbulbifer okhotskensis]